MTGEKAGRAGRPSLRPFTVAGKARRQPKDRDVSPYTMHWPNPLLRAVDERAARVGITRAYLIRILVERALGRFTQADEVALARAVEDGRV